MDLNKIIPSPPTCTLYSLSILIFVTLYRSIFNGKRYTKEKTAAASQSFMDIN